MKQNSLLTSKISHLKNPKKKQDLRLKFYMETQLITLAKILEI